MIRSAAPVFLLVALACSGSQSADGGVLDAGQPDDAGLPGHDGGSADAGDGGHGTLPIGLRGLYHLDRSGASDPEARALDLQLYPDGGYLAAIVGCDFQGNSYGEWFEADGGVHTTGGVFITGDGGQLLTTGALCSPYDVGGGTWFRGGLCVTGGCAPNSGTLVPCTPDFFEADDGGV